MQIPRRLTTAAAVMLALLPVTGPVTGCSDTNEPNAAPTGSSTGAVPPAPAQPDMALKELCPAKPRPDVDVSGEVRRTPDVIAKAKATAEENAKANDERLKVAAALDRICDKVMTDFVAGKPFPTGTLKIDAVHSITLASGALKDRDGDAVVACHAVATNSDAPCERIADADVKADCKMRRDFMQAAKKAPGSTDWRVTKSFLALCKKNGEAKYGAKEAGEKCDAFAAAIRAGDPSKCPAVEGLERCAALASGDPSKCVKKDDHVCVAEATRYHLINEGGLAKLAAEGTEEDKIEAAAAMGKKDACAPFAQRIKLACINVQAVTALPALLPPEAVKEWTVPRGGKPGDGGAPGMTAPAGGGMGRPANGPGAAPATEPPKPGAH